MYLLSYFSTLGARLGHIFAKRHPLKPERKERKRIGGQVMKALAALEFPSLSFLLYSTNAKALGF